MIRLICGITPEHWTLRTNTSPYAPRLTTPSWMRAPPESLIPITGQPILAARSMILTSFSAITSPSEPPNTVKSWEKTHTRRPSIVPWPVTTASPHGRFFSIPNSLVRWRTKVSSSWKEPGSSSFSIRSRAVYLPLACCFSTAVSDAWWTAAARSSSSWASRSSEVSGLLWRMRRGILCREQHLAHVALAHLVALAQHPDLLEWRRGLGDEDVGDERIADRPRLTQHPHLLAEVGVLVAEDLVGEGPADRPWLGEHPALLGLARGQRGGAGHRAGGGEDGALGLGGHRGQGTKSPYRRLEPAGHGARWVAGATRTARTAGGVRRPACRARRSGGRGPRRGAAERAPAPPRRAPPAAPTRSCRRRPRPGWARASPPRAPRGRPEPPPPRRAAAARPAPVEAAACAGRDG